jgi:proteasome assembly chaperone 3
MRKKRLSLQDAAMSQALFMASLPRLHAPTSLTESSLPSLKVAACLTGYVPQITTNIIYETHISRNKQVQVPLEGSSAGMVEMTLPNMKQSLLPSTHLTPKTLLGGGGEQRETLGHLYAAQIASQVSLRSPDDRRTLVLGLGLEKIDVEREGFFDLLELAQKVF